MAGRWKIGAQLSTSHSAATALDPHRMLETVRSVNDSVGLDLLIIGFRDAPGVFRAFCDLGRPVDETYLWFNALSDIDGMADSDLVVNWRGARSRGWGGWAEKGGEVEETFRFVCPNNPAARAKSRRRLRDLLDRYPFTGVFLDKIRFPSPANGVDEMMSCFCEHCRVAARSEDLDLDAVVGMLEAGARFADAPTVARVTGRFEWANPLLSRFLAFRAACVSRFVATLAEDARSLGRKVSLDLFSPCLASLLGQDYGSLKAACDWVKPMTYRLALGPAGLRLEIPALIDGVASRFGLDPHAFARLLGFDDDMVRQTRETAVPFSFIEKEIVAAVNASAPAPVLFGLELVSQPGVIDVRPADVVGMVKAGLAANAAGLVISWDLMHAPADGVATLAGALKA